MKGLLKSLIISSGLVLIMPNLTAEQTADENTDAKSENVLIAEDTSIDHEIDSAEQTATGDDEDSDKHDFPLPIYNNGIAAIVNGEIITVERLRMDIGPLIPRIQAESRNEQEFRENLYNAEMDVLNSTINRKLIVEAFLAKGGKILDTYERREYENYLQRVFGGNRLEFSKFLKEYGKSVREFKTDVRERAIINFAMSELHAAQEEVSPAKIKAYYESHVSDFFRPREIELKQIIVFDDDSGAKKKLATIEHALSNGDSFESVAKRYSDSFVNYNLGYIAVNDLLPEVVEAVDSLNTGTYSKLVELNGATHIFFVSGEHPAHQQTLQEANSAIYNRLFYQYEEEARVKWLTNLRNKAYIRIFLQK